MTHYIRNAKGETLIDIETTQGDIIVHTDIEVYTSMLLDLDAGPKSDKFVEMVIEGEYLRLTYFEGYDTIAKKPIHDVTDTVAHVKEWCMAVIRIYPDLSYTID